MGAADLSLSKMVFGTTTRALARKFSTSAVARSQGWQQYGIPGSNLPFDISNKYKLIVFFALFFSSGFSAPFVLVRHQILKVVRLSGWPGRDVCRREIQFYGEWARRKLSAKPSRRRIVSLVWRDGFPNCQFEFIVEA